MVKGTTENLNMLNEKVDYIGFELGEIPEFLKEFEPLNYRVPRVYDETTYKIYKYVPIEDIEIMITPTNRLDSLEEKYKNASPLFTYMDAYNKENIDKYARFLKMLNQTKIEEIREVQEEQEKMEIKPPLEVKFKTNFKWQIYYSDFADKYFMLASSDETDNAELFYLLKKKIEENKDKRKKKSKIFIPICNEEYTEKILRKSEISDLENYLWFFTKNWPSIYEVTSINNQMSLQITGDTPIYDKMTSKYNIKFIDRKEALKEYKLIKALFILGYDIQQEYEFETKIDNGGNIEFYYENEEITYDNLSDFIKKQAMLKIKENADLKIETTDLKADIADLQNYSKEKDEEYLLKQKQIYTFLECRKSFFGKVKYFFKNKKENNKKDAPEIAINKDRMKNIISKDKEEKIYKNDEDNKLYTVEDMIRICKEYDMNLKENTNIKLDITAIKNKITVMERKIKNADSYINEIENHRKSIFDFWKFANKEELNSLEEGNDTVESNSENLKKTFNYEDDIEILANRVDKKQRESLTHNELDATFAANFVLDGINIMSKKQILKSDEEKINKILENLKSEYKANIDKIENKDFDIFGNVSEDKTKIKTLKNTTHREVEKDKFKILNINLNTQLQDFTNKLEDLKNILKEESNKIETPYNISIYKASIEKLGEEEFSKFSLNPSEALEKIENTSDEKEIYLYKINVPEKTNLVFYSNIMFYENNNGTLPLGMDISQEILIDMDLYKLKLKNSGEFNINVCKNEYESFIRKVKVYEYDISKE